MVLGISVFGISVFGISGIKGRSIFICMTAEAEVIVPGGKCTW